MRLLNTTLFSVLIAATSSCTTAFQLDHRFGAREVAGFEAEAKTKQAFEFQLAPNAWGVYFTIANRTDSEAIIDWKNCFFTDPLGNTYEALNTERLSTAGTLDANRTLIPARTRVGRFTTAAIDVEARTVTPTFDHPERVRFTHLVDHGNGWSATPVEKDPTEAAETLAAEGEGYWFSRAYYRDGTAVRAKHQFSEEVRRVSALTPMVLGLRLLTAEGHADFRFEFPLEAIYWSSFDSWERVNGKYAKSRKLHYYSTAESGWQVFDAKGRPTGE